MAQIQWDWQAPSILMEAWYADSAGWRAIQVLVRPRPTGTNEKQEPVGLAPEKVYWAAEAQRLSERHPELKEASSYIIGERQWR